jgi:hypothetical protein
MLSCHARRPKDFVLLYQSWPPTDEIEELGRIALFPETISHAVCNRVEELVWYRTCTHIISRTSHAVCNRGALGMR